MAAHQREDLPYVAAITAVTVAGLAVEGLALRRRPAKQATWSAQIWLLLGPRYGWRWWLGVGLYAAGAKHWLFRKASCAPVC